MAWLLLLTLWIRKPILGENSHNKSYNNVRNYNRANHINNNKKKALPTTASVEIMKILVTTATVMVVKLLVKTLQLTTSKQPLLEKRKKKKKRKMVRDTKNLVVMEV